MRGSSLGLLEETTQSDRLRYRGHVLFALEQTLVSQAAPFKNDFAKALAQGHSVFEKRVELELDQEDKEC